MVIALALLSLAIAAISLYGVLIPAGLTGLVRRFMAGPGIPAAAAIRVAFAVLLWIVAPESRTPTLFKALAVLALLSAAFLPLMGAERLLGLIDRVSSWPPALTRLLSLFGVALGTFLLWSSWPGLGIA